MHTLQPNIPDHNSLQQLGLSHSLLLVSAAPGHFVWSHQWHQICTAERQPLVGGRQERGLQEWPGWTSFLWFVPSQSAFCTSAHFMYCNQNSWLTVKLTATVFISALIPTNIFSTWLIVSEIWLVDLGGQGTVLGKPVQACCCQQIFFAVHMFKLTQLMYICTYVALRKLGWVWVSCMQY